MEETLVAWRVDDVENGRGVVVFEPNKEAAQQAGADELNSEIDYVECQRESQYDCYASNGFVPKKVLITNGWWFECDHCGYRIDEDAEDEYGAKKPVSDVIEVGRHALYCNQGCKDDWDRHVLEINNKFEAFKGEVQELRPDLTFVKFSGGYPYVYNWAHFTFPGGVFSGRIDQRDGELDWSVAKKDLAAWDAHESTRKVAVSSSEGDAQ